LSYVKLGGMDMIPPASVKSFQINGKEVMVINDGGRLFCLQARCTHAGAPLAEGTIENGILTCPWHGSKFRIATGEVVRGPAETGLQVFKYVIKDNLLYLEVD